MSNTYFMVITRFLSSYAMDVEPLTHTNTPSLAYTLRSSHFYLADPDDSDCSDDDDPGAS